MPQVVNGCGTWYYGKSNVVEYQGRCQSCQAVGTLTSYDTRLWFVVFFIPVIPLGRKRIIEQCAACSRHAAMDLAEWHKLRARLDETSAAYQQSPGDPERAKEAVAAMAAARDVNGFLALAPQVERALAEDAEMLKLLAAVHQLFGGTQEAERLLRAALARKADDDTREQLAGLLLARGEAEEAAPLLRHIADKGIPDRVDLLYTLAQCFASKGEHARAFEVYGQCEAVLPHIGQDETFASLKKFSQDNLGTGRKADPASLGRRLQRQKAMRKTARYAPAVIAVAIAAYAGLCLFLGAARRVYLVNGLEHRYVARINGKDYELQPGDARAVRLGEGDMRVEMRDARTSSTPDAETVKVRTDFLKRPFLNRTFVINPDRTALLMRSTVFYSKNDAAQAPVSRFSGGQLLNVFDGIDHAFEEPPRKISVRQGSGRVTRSVLTAIPGSPQVLLELNGEADRQLLAAVASQQLLYFPDSAEVVTALGQLVEPEARIKLLKPFLARRPLLVSCHRGFQDARNRLCEERALEEEYAKLAAAEPDNPDMLYLYGRACVDRRKALELVGKSASTSAPSTFAFEFLCHCHLANARFAEAASAARKALALNGSDEQAESYLFRALMGAGQYDEALKLAKSRVDRDETRLWLRSISIYAAMGKADMARDCATSAIAAARRSLRGTDIEAYGHSIRAHAEYCLGNEAGFADHARRSRDSSLEFYALLTSATLVRAEQMPVPAGEAGLQRHLCLFLAALHFGNAEAAKRQQDKLVERLREHGHVGRAAAAALAGEPVADPQMLLEADAMGRQKPLLLAALAIRDPAHRQQYCDLARKLNHSPGIPHLLIKAVLDGLAGK